MGKNDSFADKSQAQNLLVHHKGSFRIGSKTFLESGLKYELLVNTSLQFRNLNVLLLFLSLLAASCTPVEHTDEGTTKIKLDPRLSSSLHLSERFSSIRYVPLVTGPGLPYIGDFRKIWVEEDKVYILPGLHSEYTSVLVYNVRDGQLFYQIQPPNEGPNKMLTVSDFAVDPVNSNLELADHYQKKVQIYTEGILQEEKELPYDFSKLVKFPNGKYCLFTGNYPTAQPNRLLLFDPAAGQLLQTGFPYEEFLSMFILIGRMNFSPAWIEGESATYLFNTVLDNRIFAVTPDSLYPKYEIDLGNVWIENDFFIKLKTQPTNRNILKEVINREDHVFDIRTFFENESYLIFAFNYGGKVFWNFFDRQSKVLESAAERINDLDFGLVGDMKFWPLFLHEDQLVFVLPAENVLEHLEAIAQSRGLKVEELGKNTDNAYYRLGTVLQPTSNPVLAFAKLK